MQGKLLQIWNKLSGLGKKLHISGVTSPTLVSKHLAVSSLYPSSGYNRLKEEKKTHMKEMIKIKPFPHVLLHADQSLS